MEGLLEGVLRAGQDPPMQPAPLLPGYYIRSGIRGSQVTQALSTQLRGPALHEVVLVRETVIEVLDVTHMMGFPAAGTADAATAPISLCEQAACGSVR